VHSKMQLMLNDWLFVWLIGRLAEWLTELTG
jgi:hypothetical protein